MNESAHERYIIYSKRGTGTLLATRQIHPAKHVAAHHDVLIRVET